ncbi:hypothetical protein HC928_06255 [bacterium]|nr:hypothetical protein [bacterium]
MKHAENEHLYASHYVAFQESLYGWRLESSGIVVVRGTLTECLCAVDRLLTPFDALLLLPESLASGYYQRAGLVVALVVLDKGV